MMTSVMMTPVMKKGEEGGVQKIETESSQNCRSAKAYVSHPARSKMSKIQAQ
jgi:hypothetical protein